MWKKVIITYHSVKDFDTSLWLVVPKDFYQAMPGKFHYFDEDILDEIAIQSGSSSYDESINDPFLDKCAVENLRNQQKRLINAFRDGRIEVEDLIAFDGTMSEEDFEYHCNNVLFPPENPIWDETQRD